MNQLFNKLIFESQKIKATDIHFSLYQEKCLCEIRGMNGFIRYEHDQLNQLFQYLKYCANLDLGNLTKPQSGTFQKMMNHKEFYFRFSCISTIVNETGVLRILNNHPLLSIDELSYKKAHLRQFKKWCNMRSGLVIFSGPTGSGKTTTLHTLLSEISKNKKLKIITLEDPIEIVSTDYLQLQINEKINFTFEEGIKQLLRHDPDVIMIGEIRDSKCAEMVYRAALSGHLVFTTLHAKSAQEAIKRLLELGLTTSNLKNTLTGVVNQRLYPNYDRKGRSCIYEILCNESLQDVLECKNIKHKSIQDEIKDAVKKKIIRASDAKYDL